jgi:hypothetical protein
VCQYQTRFDCPAAAGDTRWTWPVITFVTPRAACFQQGERTIAWQSLIRRIHWGWNAIANPYRITASHAYAIGQSYGSVPSDDAEAVARLVAICKRLEKRYPECSFHTEPEYPDATKTSIYGDTRYIDDEASGAFINIETGDVTRKKSSLDDLE